MTADRAATERLVEATLTRHRMWRERDMSGAVTYGCTCDTWVDQHVVEPEDFAAAHRAHVTRALLDGPVGEALAAEAARAEAAEAKVARVEALARWFQRQINWRDWGVHTQIARALVGLTEGGEGER